MKFLADENILTSLVKELRKKGHDVKDIKEEQLIGISDNILLNLAKKDNRILITFDKDFTNLSAFPLQAHCGVIVLRYKNKHTSSVVPRFCTLVESSVIEKFEDNLCEDYCKISHSP